MPNARFWRRALVLAAGALALAALAPAWGSAEPPQRADYIVVLKGDVGDVSAVAAEHARRFGGQIKYVYEHALKGYSISLPPQAIEGLSHNPQVAYVESDAEVRADTTQSDATWGIDRIDQRSLPLSGTFTYTNTGASVTAYVIDTGIRFDHAEFGGRASTGYDAVTSGGSAADCNGHGTHVAGTIGGTTYGVAKGATLVAVRVLGCSGSGSTSGVIAGIDWVTGSHVAGQPAVANMSLGGSASTALDDAVRRSISDGVSYAIAAGNGNAGGIGQNACNSSPARVAEAMTISAVDRTDKKASWANYGSCVDWFAPGVSITSAWWTSSTATNTISGTSMATPHTAGVAALYLEGNPTASAATVRDALYAQTAKGIVTSSRTTNNHLLFTSY
jgi:subtilisin family serine protease